MKFDAAYFPSRDYGADAIGIAQLESAGVAAVWALRSARNPFFSLSVAAAWTRRIQLGVLEDATFSRSPMVTAQIGWDLARQSGGRFALGLGGAPPAHQSDAFDEDYGDAEGRMREVNKSCARYGAHSRMMSACVSAATTTDSDSWRPSSIQDRSIAPTFPCG